MTDKQLTTILSPIQKLATVAESVDKKVAVMYELTVQGIKQNEIQIAELKKQTSILQDIKAILKGQEKNLSKNDKEGGKSTGSFAGLGKLGKDTVGIAAMAMIGISVAILATAGMFSLIPVVSPMQILTAIAISIAFIPMAISFAKVAEALSKMKGTIKAQYGGMKMSKTDSSGLMPLVGSTLLALIGMSVAVAATSWIFQLIMPVSAPQLLTALGISLAMIGMGYAFAKISEAISKIKGKPGKNKIGGGATSVFQAMGAGLMSLVGFSAAIVLSSWIMQLIVPVSPINLLTALLISVVMIPAAYAYIKIADALSKLKDKKGKKGKGNNIWAMMGATLLSMVGIAAALTISSWIFQLVVPVSGAQLLTAFLIGVVMIPAAFAFSLIAKSLRRANFKQLLFAMLAMPMIAIGLVASAWVFTFLPDEFKAPPVDWTLKSGLALAVFGIAFVALAYTVGKLPIKDILFGVIGVAAVAIAILATAWIFSILPDSFLAPDLGWSISAMVSIILFAIPVGIIGAIIMATGGTGLAAIALGVVGIIIIAAGILAVAWIFSYIPADKLAAVSKGLTEALMAPLNGIVDVLVRLKNEIGVDQLIPLAVGIIAISVSLMALAGATAGVAAGGLLSSIANVGKAFFDGIAGFFGGEKAKGPMDILNDLVKMAPKITTLADGMDKLASALGRTVGYLTLGNISRINEGIRSVVLTDVEMMMANKFTVKEYFNAYPKFLNDVAAGYRAITAAQSGMDVKVLEKTTEMIKALAYLNEIGGDNAMAKLGESLVNAVQELAEMLKSFGGKIEENTESGKKSTGVLGKLSDKLSNAVGVGGGSSSASGGGSTTVNFDSDEIVDAIKELQRVLVSKRY